MKNKIIIMGIISGLLGLLGCNNRSKDSATGQDAAIQTMNLSDVQYSIPTLENAMPEFEGKIDMSNLNIHEDDWRQIEFVSKSQKDSIDKEIAKIKDIYDHHSSKDSDYIFFSNMAIRNSITQPLHVDFAKIKSYLTDQDIRLKGLSFFNNSGQVVNGFSFSAEGIDYYGQFDDNKKIKWFCISSQSDLEKNKSLRDKLTKLLAGENLYLVDWCGMKVFDENNIKAGAGL